MYNRYRGNGSRPERIPEPERQTPEPRRRVSPQNAPEPVMKRVNAGRRAGPVERLAHAIPEKLGELETEDLLLILILYLMYRESGDTELLIIIGAMYLL